MRIPDKYPLVTCTDGDMIKRVYGDRLHFVRCPFANSGYCSISCAHIGIFDKDEDNGLPGLICRQGGDTFVPIGIVDVESFDLDLIDMLRAGSDLRDQFLATQKPVNSDS
jgi:hypothetical protein